MQPLSTTVTVVTLVLQCQYQPDITNIHGNANHNTRSIGPTTQAGDCARTHTWALLMPMKILITQHSACIPSATDIIMGWQVHLSVRLCHNQQATHHLLRYHTTHYTGPTFHHGGSTAHCDYPTGLTPNIIGPLTTPHSYNHSLLVHPHITHHISCTVMVPDQSSSHIMRTPMI